MSSTAIAASVLVAYIVFGLTLALNTFVPGTYTNTANKLKEQCEKSLPRDQVCKMVFVPERQP